ncbi:MAG TPA: arabinan endo-1,5-alpha-L-arabinosidase [Rhizomicrobium sp.]|jgi:arabinan endo-1,5-alpha-L-arabinosidase
MNSLDAIQNVFSRRRVMLGSLGAAAALPFLSADAQTLEPLNPKLSGDIYPIHDPCIIKAGDTFYVFCTTPRGDAPAQIPWYRSKDLVQWERGGHALAALPDWAKTEIPGTEACWAPDISFVGGQYLLYYACSTFGSNHSVIGLATNATLDPADPKFGWKDQGLVLESQTSDDYNALDPQHVIDREGKHWLAFGSFWSGLKILQLDPRTGKPLAGAERHAIVQRPEAPDAVEGVYIISRAGNYYLFCSYDFCCRGANSSYYTVVGRAPNILGPYLDKDGKSMMEGGGSLVLAAGAGEPRWRGPGHCAIVRDGIKDYIVYHAYDARHDGRPTLRVAPLGWTDDNWPVAFV